MFYDVSDISEIIPIIPEICWNFQCIDVDFRLAMFTDFRNFR